MQLLIDIFIPLLIVFIMLVVGLNLTLADFTRVAQFPKTVFVAVLVQLIFLPLIGFMVIIVVQPSIFITAGIILVVASPGGALSNYYVYIAHSNVALTITLTAVTSIICFITLPLLVSFGFDFLLENKTVVDIPVMKIMAQLFILLFLPTVLGMWLRDKYPDWILAKVKMLRNLSLLALLLMILFVIWDQHHHLLLYLNELVLAASTYTALALLVGWLVSKALRLNSKDTFALMIEFSIRNLGIVTLVGASLLNSIELVVFAAAFLIIQTPIMLMGVYLQRKKN